VIKAEFNSRMPVIQELIVPCFQPLEKIVGSLDDIHSKIELLKRDVSTAWLEIEYTGSDIITNLREILEEALADSSMEIRRIKNKQITDQVIYAIQENETLDDLDVNDVFDRCLDTFDVPHEDRVELIDTYNEIIKSFHEEDTNAE
jgi:exonuclease SbcD